MQKMLGTEHGGMNEALANLYGLTGEEKYLEIAAAIQPHGRARPGLEAAGPAHRPARQHADPQVRRRGAAVRVDRPAIG